MKIINTITGEIIGTIITNQSMTIEEALDLIGETAANLLLEKIKNPDAPDRTVVLDARINIRESTDVRPQQ